MDFLELKHRMDFYQGLFYLSVILPAAKFYADNKPNTEL